MGKPSYHPTLSFKRKRNLRDLVNTLITERVYLWRNDCFPSFPSIMCFGKQHADAQDTLNWCQTSSKLRVSQNGGFDQLISRSALSPLTRISWWGSLCSSNRAVDRSALYAVLPSVVTIPSFPHEAILGGAQICHWIYLNHRVRRWFPFQAHPSLSDVKKNISLCCYMSPPPP